MKLFLIFVAVVLALVAGAPQNPAEASGNGNSGGQISDNKGAGGFVAPFAKAIEGKHLI